MTLGLGKDMSKTLPQIGRKALCALALAAAALVSTPDIAMAERNGAFLKAKTSTTAPMGARNICSKYSWACATTGRASTLTRAQLNMVARLNVKINRQVNEIADSQQYRREEVWALPTFMGGDCEDFALLKKRELVKAGIAPERLLIATVLDRNRQSHAVLVLRTSSGDYILDNLTNKIKKWTDTGYVFLRIQNANAPTQWSAVLAFASPPSRA
ncbi:MAG: transglutaminase-like cysteine peptidase [Pseudomonadota bacterium]